MRKYGLMISFSIFIFIFVLCLLAAGDSRKSGKASAGPVPDKAYMQKVLDGWSTLDPSDAAKFYAAGPGTFFDITPLEYSSWEDYEAGVRKVVANYQSIKFALNNDAVVHAEGDCAWGTATIKEDALLKSGKRELATLRWTVIWEKRDVKWLIVHDHTSEPLQ
jgi:ketosteroid isomerase-like protein